MNSKSFEGFYLSDLEYGVKSHHDHMRKQIPILNKIFTPSEEKVKRAKKIISLFENADTGLVVIDGKLIEKPVLRF